MKLGVKLPVGCAACPVRCLTIAADLAPEVLAEFNRHIVQRRLAPGQQVLVEGEPCTELFIVHAGRLKLYYQNEEGKEQIIDLAGPGDLVGEAAIWEGGRCDVSAAAVEEAVVCALPGAYFRWLVQARPEVAWRVLALLGAKLAHSRLVARDLALKRARERLAGVLLRLAAKEGEPVRDGVHLKMPLKVETLAYLAGLTPETAARIMSRWRKEGIIRREKRRLVFDPKKLAPSAEN
ncbi:Crp/Fnr family transcriptional regulator [Thermodesulfitimonas autotrophica]|uniref:Crp/Fnr family transcriptional regulator n=1 Tax=Thermodesulfitimonas autotrophica TaxID=1894989 RepID=UPI002FE32E51